MGWLLSPMVFTKFVRPVIAFLHCPALLHTSWRWLPIYLVLCELGPMFVSMYLNDLLALLSCACDTVALATVLFELFARLGIMCHRSKSQPDPVPCLKHLGLTSMYRGGACCCVRYSMRSWLPAWLAFFKRLSTVNGWLVNVNLHV